MIFAATHGAVITIGLILIYSRAKPHVQFAAAALIMACGAAASYVTIPVMGQVPEPRLHDTYLVVSHFHQLASLAIFWGVIAVAVWALVLLDAVYWPRLTLCAFWALVFGIAANTLLSWVAPLLIGRLGDEQELRLVGITSIALSSISRLGFLTITVLVITSFIRRWRRPAQP